MTFKSRHLQTNKQTLNVTFQVETKLSFCWGFYAFGSSQRTFCSSAVISCSAFTSLNFRSLICLFESPAKVQPKNILDLLDTSSSKTQQLVRLGARGYSLWSSKMFGSAPFSRISPSGFELFSVPFRWVFCSNWNFSFFTCRPSPNTSADLCHHTTLSPVLRSQ